MNKEIWKVIPQYENYEASTLGRIRNKTTKYVLKPHKNNRGYLTYSILKKQVKGHRLVAQTFIPNPKNLSEVNHIDENKENNKVDNLMWCTHQENSSWGTRNKRIAQTLNKKVMQFDLNNNFLKEWNSIKEAKIYTNSCHIGCCCSGKRKTAGGYIWKYKEEK